MAGKSTWHCDNMMVLVIINSGSSREPDAMHLRRCLAISEVKWGIQLWAKNVKGADNQVADDVSR